MPHIIITDDNNYQSSLALMAGADNLQWQIETVMAKLLLPYTWILERTNFEYRLNELID